VSSPLFAPDTPVRVEIPAARVTFDTTRVHVRVTTGTYLGRPAYEHTHSRVRVNGTLLTLPDEYLTALDGSLTDD
jgi:hypothetical protein